MGLLAFDAWLTEGKGRGAMGNVHPSDHVFTEHVGNGIGVKVAKSSMPSVEVSMGDSSLSDEG